MIYSYKCRPNIKRMLTPTIPSSKPSPLHCPCSTTSSSSPNTPPQPPLNLPLNSLTTSSQNNNNWNQSKSSSKELNFYFWKNNCLWGNWQTWGCRDFKLKRVWAKRNCVSNMWGNCLWGRARFISRRRGGVGVCRNSRQSISKLQITRWKSRIQV